MGPIDTETSTSTNHEVNFPGEKNGGSRLQCIGADERTRTSTTLRPLEPESSASANSATSALMQPAFCQSGKILSIRGPEPGDSQEILHDPRLLVGQQFQDFLTPVFQQPPRGTVVMATSLSQNFSTRRESSLALRVAARGNSSLSCASHYKAIVYSELLQRRNHAGLQHNRKQLPHSLPTSKMLLPMAAPMPCATPALWRGSFSAGWL